VPRPGASQRAERRDVYADSPVGELHDPLLPRWFVLLAIAAVLAAIATLVAAFVVFGPEEVPVEARRPPPSGTLTHDVGEFVLGETDAVPYEAACPQLEGVRIAGFEADRALLRQALAALCNTPLDDDAVAALAAFSAGGGVVRFAAFEATGVDSAADLDGARILVNAKFVSMARPRWIAPVVAHDAVVLAGDPEAAETALRARQVEADVCRRLLGTEDASRGCEDAEALLALPDPLAALRSAGYR
jgi:hypothetical protein